MSHPFLTTTPQSWVQLSTREQFSLAEANLAPLQLQWAAKRFARLRDRIPALAILAQKQNIQTMDDFAALASLLFTHQTYKNYPMAYIEKKNFNELTRWLDKLTAHDLSRIDASGVTSIDEWLNLLDQNGMFVFHSTGTSGKLSFFPRSQVEKTIWVEATYAFMEAFMPGIRNLTLPVFWPAYRGGRQASMRLIEHFGPLLAGGEAEYHSLFDTKMSADFMSIAMRVKHAQDRGDLKTVDLLKAVLQTKGEIVTLKARRASLTKNFFDKMIREYRGRRVFLMASATDLLDVALQGLESGSRSVFASDSVLLTGGGFKGRKEVVDWKEKLREFYGVQQVHMSYGMTELNAYHTACPKGHYHVFPWNLVMVLDPESGALLPRSGVQTGRAGYFDLLAETYWGGILTGDRITVHYDEECGCGWQGPWIEDNVQRFTELMGGDDIISCAGVQNAYSDLAEYMAADIPEVR